MNVKSAVCVVLAGVPFAIANAQDWSALETLTFVPVSLEQSLPARDSIPSRDSRDDLAQDGRTPEFVVSRIQTVLEDIEATAAANGDYSLELLPALGTLAGIYRETGDLGDAIVALERAQQIVRRREGLYSLNQAAWIEQMIEIEMAITPNEQSIELESDLRELVQRNPGDPRNAGIMMNMAERQMSVVRYLLINGMPPTFDLSLNSVNDPSRVRFSQPRTARSMTALMLRRARASYGSAMREVMTKGTDNIPLLFELEDSIIDTYYFELMNPKLRVRGQSYRDVGRLRFGGVNALEAKLNNSRLYPGTPEAVNRALIELADWHLMFGSFGRAMGIYEAVVDRLRSEDDGDERVAAIFAAAAPVPLPAFESSANVYSDQSDVRGHVDVEIEINQYGRVVDVTVIGGSANASKSVERSLKRFVYQSRFRPRYADGEWQRRDRFSLRYLFGYSS